MAPFDPTSVGAWGEPLAHVIIGVLFGFVLERAGFGSSKKLTAQFYLADMSVLKVMFTAIITAMLLIYWSVGFGVLDLDRIWINPTYLLSGVLGGLIFGVGFLVGGYCPGTALVALATLKLDALFFVLGTLGGIALFGYTVPYFVGFWNHAGAVGTLTLFDWLGISPPLTVLAAVMLAVAMFVGATVVERWMRGRNTAKAGGTP